MITETNDKKFYIIFAQFKQQQKEMDRNTVETIIVGADHQSRHSGAQCFDVACEKENKTRWQRWVTPSDCSCSVCICNSRPRNSCGSLKSRRRCTILTVGDFGGLKRAARYLTRNNFEQRGAVSKVLREVSETTQSQSETTHKQKTRPRELYDRDLSDDEDHVTKRWRGQMENTYGRSTLLTFIARTISSTSPHELLWTTDHWKLFWSRRG